MDLRVNTRDGSTLSFCLPDQLDIWSKNEHDLAFQCQITGVSMLHNGHVYALPVPSAFRRVRYSVEVKPNGNGLPAAARVACVADDVTASLTVYFGSNLSRYDLRRTGKLRWPSDGD